MMFSWWADRISDTQSRRGRRAMRLRMVAAIVGFVLMLPTAGGSTTRVFRVGGEECIGEKELDTTYSPNSPWMRKFFVPGWVGGWRMRERAGWIRR